MSPEKTTCDAGKQAESAPGAALARNALIRSYGHGTIDWTWELDINGVIREASDNVHEVLGYRREELIGMQNMDFCATPEERERVGKILAEIREGGTAFTAVEQRLRHRDGRVLVLESYGTPLRGSRGELVGFRGVSRDVTARMASEQALRRSEELLRESQRIASLGHYRLDLAKGLWESSEALDQLFGIGPGYPRDVEGWVALVHPAEQVEMRRYLEEDVLGRRGQFDREYRIVRASDGVVRWMHGLGHLEIGPNGLVASMMGTIQDVTSRKETQLALSESEHRFRLAMEATSDGLCDWHVAENRIHCSSGCARMLGLKEEVIPDRFPDWLDLLVREDRQTLHARMQECIEGRAEHYSAEFRMLASDGGVRWVLGRGNVVARDANGRATRLVGTLTDISERRQLEEQLRQAQKLEAVGQLAGGIAHDFNNILASMALQIDLLAEDSSPAELKQGLLELERSVSRASKLTRQLLLFSRRSMLQKHPISLNDVITHVLQMLGRLIGENIQLRFEPAPELPHIEADAGMVEQVLMNLSVNARDAMPNGGTLTIRTAMQVLEAEGASRIGRQSGRYATLQVIDNGCGMPEPVKKRLFEPFFTTKDVGRGTGLGLATVHGIVTQHRGWVDVQSEPGAGSCFTVYWPALDTVTASAAPASQRSLAPGGAESILVVEDEEGLRRAIVGCLRRLGYEVIQAENGREAIDVARGAAIDLLLTDRVMPGGIDGEQLAAKLRGENPSLRVIISTGYSPERAGTEIEFGPGVMYLAKPYQLATLGETVRRCLDSNSAKANG